MEKPTTSGELAVSLHYDGVSAPQLSAKGQGEIAQQILALATEHDVPIYQNSELLSLLMRLELDEEIPQGLYIAVAEVLSFAYKLKDKLPPGYTPDETF